MSSTRKAVVAVSVGVVEAMKDQGICRWNFIIRSAQQHAKNNLRSISQTRNLSSSTSAMVSSKLRDEKMKQSEESLRKVIAHTLTLKHRRDAAQALCLSPPDPSPSVTASPVPICAVPSPLDAITSCRRCEPPSEATSSLSLAQ
ncbi:hypothetical protein SO802_015618 [Lithocarpus litseifolius]|uniref:Uncharacterized protein n=1 Tax=Lithocarpus litseifolius TaxID=425828 RepID=A0AAW2CU66_9ROSI